jgi:hypothetical protein
MATFPVSNWCDIQNTNVGGAELYTQEVFSRLARRFGHKVTLHKSMTKGSDWNEQVDEIETVSRGRRYSTYSKAKSLFKEPRDKLDVVVDENNKPFLTHRYAESVRHSNQKLVLEYWWCGAPFPTCVIGYYFLKTID